MDPKLRNAREASARHGACSAPTRRGLPTSVIRWFRAYAARHRADESKGRRRRVWRSDAWHRTRPLGDRWPDECDRESRPIRSCAGRRLQAPAQTCIGARCLCRVRAAAPAPTPATARPARSRLTPRTAVSSRLPHWREDVAQPFALGMALWTGWPGFGGVSASGPVLGPCGGELVAVELGEVVGCH